MDWYKTAQLVPGPYTPTPTTPYVFSIRMRNSTSLTNTGRRRNAEYVLRIYWYPVINKYAVIAFNGRWDGSLRAQFKGDFNFYRTALNHLNNISNEQNADGYQITNPEYLSNNRLPGRFIRFPNNVGNHEAFLIQETATSTTATTTIIPTPSVRQPTPAPPPVRIEPVEPPKRSKEEEEEDARIEIAVTQIDHPDIKILSEMDDEMFKKVCDIVEGRFDDNDASPRDHAFIRAILNSPLKDRILSLLPLAIFNKVKLYPAEAKIVDNYFAIDNNEISDDDLILLSKNDSWYTKVSQKNANIDGYFKYVMASNASKSFYDVWWTGHGNDLRIIEHGLPEDLFREQKDKIMMEARKNSEEMYRRAINDQIKKY